MYLGSWLANVHAMHTNIDRAAVGGRVEPIPIEKRITPIQRDA
jgi:hypothetical protein